MEDNVYLVGFDRSYEAQRKGTRYAAPEELLISKASDFIGIGMNSPENEFSFLFRDFSLAAPFYELLMERVDQFPDTINFRKFSLEEISLTQKEQAFLDSKDMRDRPDLIGRV